MRTIFPRPILIAVLIGITITSIVPWRVRRNECLLLCLFMRLDLIIFANDVRTFEGRTRIYIHRRKADAFMGFSYYGITNDIYGLEKVSKWTSFLIMPCIFWLTFDWFYNDDAVILILNIIQSARWLRWFIETSKRSFTADTSGGQWNALDLSSLGRVVKISSIITSLTITGVSINTLTTILFSEA